MARWPARRGRGPVTSTVARSWLYVPGHHPERVGKALRSAADMVVVDLEDAVPSHLKDVAREAVRELADDPRAPGRLWVRVNSPDTPWGAADLEAVKVLPLAGVRLPRAEHPATVRQVAEELDTPIQLLVETAAGLARAEELAGAHPRVVGIALGESDLAADLRVTSDAGLDWARGRVVVAARAAGLASPIQSVYVDVFDLDGLRRSTERGRELGFLGRSVVHPRQIQVVHDVLAPTAAEVESAQEIVDTAERAAAGGESAAIDRHGRFVDPAVVDRARLILDLASRVPNEGNT